MKFLAIILLSIFSASASAQQDDKSDRHIPSEVLDAAIRNFSRKIEVNPDDGESYHERAMVFFVQKKYKEAAADFSKSIGLKSKFQAASYFFRAVVKQAENQFDATVCDDFASAKKLGYDNKVGWQTIDKLCGF